MCAMSSIVSTCDVFLCTGWLFIFSDVCDVKYRKCLSLVMCFYVRVGCSFFLYVLLSLLLCAAIKVEKKEGEEVDYNKLRVKALKSILADRGVKCTGCTEKPEFVKKCQETEHLEM
jgi:hypothetical protein